MLPYWSLAWTVIVDEPTSTLTEVGAAVMVVVAPEAAPGVKVTDAVAVMARALIEPRPCRSG